MPWRSSPRAAWCSRAAASPSPAPRLPDVVERQERVVARLHAAGRELHRNYEPGRWVPHVSVATSAAADQVPLVVGAVSDVLPLPLHADRAVVIETGTGQMWPLPGVP